MTVHFYRYEPGSSTPIDTLPDSLHIRCWRADADGYPPRGSRSFANHCWWAFAKLKVFARRGFTEISILEGDRLLHRLIVTPAWYRFPFMSENDLQLGDLWTAPGARRRQLARAAVWQAHQCFAGENVRFWYVADADNHASAAVARSCGYRLVAVGERTRRLGSRLLGQYVIARFV